MKNKDVVVYLLYGMTAFYLILFFIYSYKNTMENFHSVYLLMATVFFYLLSMIVRKEL